MTQFKSMREAAKRKLEHYKTTPDITGKQGVRVRGKKTEKGTGRG